MNPPRQLELRPIRQIALAIVISMEMDKVIARIPELDVWDFAATEREAIDGALNAAVGLFEIMDAEGRLNEFLKHKGFTKRQEIYRTSRESRRELVRSYVNSLKWSADDPNKGMTGYIIGILSQCKAVESFTLVQAGNVWGRRYEQETEIKRAS